jgi:hypothetical protein
MYVEAFGPNIEDAGFVFQQFQLAALKHVPLAYTFGFGYTPLSV